MTSVTLGKGCSWPFSAAEFAAAEAAAAAAAAEDSAVSSGLTEDALDSVGVLELMLSSSSSPSLEFSSWSRFR